MPLYFNPQNTVEKIQLNHYFTKSKEEFIKKINRGKADQVGNKRKLDEFDAYQRGEVEDLTALKLFNHFFRLQKINYDQSTIRDLKFMLAEEDSDIELLLTCFHRAHGLKDQSQREKFESESLEKLLKIKEIQMDEAQLFVDSLPELLLTSTNYRGKIIARGIELFEMLENFIQQKSKSEICHDDESIIHDLQSMLESELTIEKILTCFHRTQDLKDQSQRKKFGYTLIEKLLRFHKIPMDEAQLLADSLPEFLLTSLDYQRRRNLLESLNRDDESMIHDLESMLESELTIKEILTCFHRAQDLKDQSQREKFESVLLEKLLKFKEIQIDDARLFVDSLPKLLSTSTKHREKIIARGIELFHMLEDFHRRKGPCVEQFDCQRRRYLLESLK